MESTPRFEFIAAFPGTLGVNPIVLIIVLVREYWSVMWGQFEDE